jgi:hypothetical protein
MRRLFALAAFLLPACVSLPPAPPALVIAPDNHAVAFLSHPEDAAFRGLTVISLPSTRTDSRRMPHRAAEITWASGHKLLLSRPDGFFDYDTTTHRFSRFFRPIADLPLGTLRTLRRLEDGWLLRVTYSPAAPNVSHQRMGDFYIYNEPRPGAPFAMRPATIELLDLLTDRQLSVAHFSKAQLEPLGPPLAALDASLSPDHKTLMLAAAHRLFFAGAWSADSIAPWYPAPPVIFDIPGATPRFTVPAAPAIVSPVTLRNDGLYAITETVGPPLRVPHESQRLTHTFHLTRFTREGAENMRELPLAHAASPIAQTFAAAFSPDKSLLVIYSLADPHHPVLLQIPLPPAAP